MSLSSDRYSGFQASAHLKFMTSIAKGQIKPKADWGALDSPKKQTYEFVLLAFLLFMANKITYFVLFWENLWRAQTLLVLFSIL